MGSLTIEQIYEVIIVFGGLFLLVLWGSFYFWVQFKKRDDLNRKKEHSELKDGFGVPENPET